MNHKEANRVRVLAEQIGRYEQAIENIRGNGVISTVDGDGDFNNGLRFTTGITIQNQDAIDMFVDMLNTEKEINEEAIANIIAGNNK